MSGATSSIPPDLVAFYRAWRTSQSADAQQPAEYPYPYPAPAQQPQPPQPQTLQRPVPPETQVPPQLSQPVYSPFISQQRQNSQARTQPGRNPASRGPLDPQQIIEEISAMNLKLNRMMEAQASANVKLSEILSRTTAGDLQEMKNTLGRFNDWGKSILGTLTSSLGQGSAPTNPPSSAPQQPNFTHGPNLPSYQASNPPQHVQAGNAYTAPPPQTGEPYSQEFPYDNLNMESFFTGSA
ncbi:uncharacterized protein PAC_15211 [Phialocephala subalpina]|uniref:Uncharacterized protein n=1 Tax=Phialocephala subalpina TaxID=576137 RepID=A0A1L7XJT3_9HELO|nr:uncharacterized protein PAC_15211 [Phialocephala subalpina]